MAEGENWLVKFILVDSGQRLSLQRHCNREEFWTVIRGSGVATVGGDTVELDVGTDAVCIPMLAWHRITAETTLEIVEVQRGQCDENDIERKEDDYGRAKKDELGGV